MMKTNTWVYIKAVLQAIVIWIWLNGFMLVRGWGNEEYQYGDEFFLFIVPFFSSFSFFVSARFGKSMSRKKYWDWMKSLDWISTIIMLLPAFALILLVYLLRVLDVMEPFHESLIYLGVYVIIAVAYTHYGLFMKEQEEVQSINQSPETV